MALTQPKILYVELRDELLSFLRANIASLNVGLEKTIVDGNEQIIKGKPQFIPSYAATYPYVLVDYSRKTEDFATIGTRKAVTIVYDIYAITRIIAEGGYDDDDEKMYLIDNIEGLLRSNLTINSTNLNLLYVRIPETIFEINLNPEIYVSGGIISIEFVVEVI